MSSNSLVDFRKRLESLCEEFGGRHALAKASGIPYSSLTHYLSRSDPTRGAIEKIVRTTGVSSDWLILGETKSRKLASKDEKWQSTWESLSANFCSQIKDRMPLSELSKVSNVPVCRLEDILDGQEPTSSEIDQISQAIDVSIDQLLHPELLRTGKGEKYLLIPRFSYTRFLQAYDSPTNSPWSLRVSGNLAEQIGDPEFRKPYRYEWLRNKWPDQLGNLVYDDVDSHELADFPKGSQVLVDLSDRGCWSGRYLVNWDGKRIFRNLEPLDSKGSSIILVSHEKDVRQPEIRMTRQELAEKDVLIGKIVWGERE